MRLLLVIAVLCWPFGNRQQPSRQAGTWYQTPHWSDGRWVEYTPEQMAAKTGIKNWAQYPFSRYVWEWPGFKEGDKTWLVETHPGHDPDKPKQWKWIPSYDPLAPGQRGNL